MARDVRRQAFERLAALATSASSTTSFDKSDLDRLCKVTAPGRAAPPPAVNGNGTGAAASSLARPDVGRVPMVANPVLVGRLRWLTAPVV